MDKSANRLILTERFTNAVEYARRLHTEYRKGTDIPYMAHLLGVAAIVMGEAGHQEPVTEDMVIAALLHDTVEDHGGLPRLNDVREKFGDNVARMVAGLSDTFAEDHDKKEHWDVRKSTYLNRLAAETNDVLLISAADKLYNARAMLEDFREIGDAVWVRFHRGADQQLWYFGELLKTFKQRPRNRVVDEFERVLRELTRLISDSAKSGLSLPKM
jgi:(p)ppGpp synthase/HD superfamily hydrolase